MSSDQEKQDARILEFKKAFGFDEDEGLDSIYSRIQDLTLEDIEEEMELELDDVMEASLPDNVKEEHYSQIQRGHIDRKSYFLALRKLQVEMVKLQDWVEATGEKIVVLFEGRDSAGKGGIITRMTQRLNPRICRVVALGIPNEREKSQWYFQRYVKHLPASGEIVFFDRSWYNRAGVERVMGFCTDEEYEEFMKTVPQFESMLVGSGIKLVKYWFSITDMEQVFRFNCRIFDPLKRWKLSPMDLQSRIRWEDYTKAKEAMLERTHKRETPWYVVEANNKKRARLNCMHHLLSLFPYEDVDREEIVLPPRNHGEDYWRKDTPEGMIVPRVF